jgi:hypothetical protein
MRGWVRSKFVEVFGADLRSLAVFRMALGVMVLVDLAYRGTDLPAFYTDGGVCRAAYSCRTSHYWSAGGSR